MYQKNGEYTEDDRVDLMISTDIEGLADSGFDSKEEIEEFIANARQEIQESLDTEIIQDRAETIAIRKEMKKLIYG